MTTALAQIVEIGLTATDSNIRIQNENQLLNFRSNQPEQFMKDCIQEFKNDSLKPQVRQSIGTILRMTLTNPLKDGQDICWRLLDINFKTEIRSACLSQLISKEILIKKASADLIASIFSIDIRENSWPDLLANLSKNTQHDNLEIKKAAIMTLGEICDKLSTME